MKRFLLIIALGALIYFNACTKKEVLSPEDTVKAFVTLSSSPKEAKDLKKLSEICTGEMEKAFAQMSLDKFKKVYLDKKITLKDFKVLLSKIGKENSAVRYQVNVENKSNDNSVSESNIREVLLTLKDGVWKISALKLYGTDQLVFNQGMQF